MAALSSEYSVRGVSLSRGRPVLQLRVDYDAAPGWYAGAFASGVALRDSAAYAELVAYGGYAQRLSSGLTWEAGATSTAFLRAREYNYHEVYAGLALDRVSGRLYLAPAYYGGDKYAYGELNGFYPLRERIKLLGHVGVLHRFGGRSADTRDRIDLRLAIAADFGDCNVQLALLARRPDAGRALPAARALAVTATYAF